jgi:hypothetical protein
MVTQLALTQQTESSSLSPSTMSNFSNSYIKYKCKECARKVDLIKMNEVPVMSRHFHPNRDGFCHASLDQVDLKELANHIKEALRNKNTEE